MPSSVELVFYMLSMSSAVDCRGSKLITPDSNSSRHVQSVKYFVYSKYFQRLQSWFQFATKQSFSEAG